MMQFTKLNEGYRYIGDLIKDNQITVVTIVPHVTDTYCYVDIIRSDREAVYTERGVNVSIVPVVLDMENVDVDSLTWVTEASQRFDACPFKPFIQRRKLNQEVYFIQAKNGLIKIGKSDCIEYRFKTLQAMSPVQLRLIGYGGSMTEAELHARFDYARQHGEWFSPTPELISYIVTHSIEVEGIHPQWVLL